MDAKFKAVHLVDPRQTAREMARICTQYAADLGELAKMPLPRFFDLVRKLPYMPDPQAAETLSRPKYLLEKDYPFRDCDDKAILVGSWCYLNGHPFGFYASSVKPNRALHHVWTVANINGRAVVIDPTYKHHKLGELPRRECITRIEKLIEVTPMQLHTYEGLGNNLGFSIGKALKSAKKGVTKAVKNDIKAIKKTGTQIKRGKVLTAAKTMAKAATAPARDLASAVARNMPSGIKGMVKNAVKKAVGDKVTFATKAALLPTATAAAMAVPGVQPFALAVPAVVNVALDEIAATAKAKAKTVVKKTVTQATAAKKAAGTAAAPSVALMQTTAKARAAELKARLEAAKAKAGSTVAQAAQAAQEPAQDAAQDVPAGINRKILIGGGVAAGLVGLYTLANQRKRG